MVTSSFDADQGMAGAAAVNVQVKTGTNNFRGSAFEYAVDARMRARNYFLPADRDKGTSSVNVFGGTIGGPIVRNKLFFFFSDESTVQRTFNGNAVGQTGTSGFVSIAPADLRRGDFSQSGTPIYDPLTGNQATAAGRVPFAYANCPGVTTLTDPRFASCNFIPQSRINPIAASMLSKLVLPTQPGYTNNYFVTNGYDTTYHKIDAKMTYNPGPRLNLNGRLGFLPSWERSLGILPSVDGSPINPLSQGRVWDSFVDSHSIGATSILSQSFVVDGSFGYTKHNVNVFPPVDTCYGDVFGLRNACQPPYSLDTNVPDMNVQGWTMNGQSPIRDYVDPQWQFVANAGWTKGSHNVKFGVDYIILQQDHYETQAQAFAFNGGVTTLNGTTNNFNRFAAFLLGLPSSRTAQVMTPLLGGDASGASHPSTGTPNEFRPNTLRNNNVGTYIRDQWNITPKITASVGVRWEYYSLPRRADHGIEVYDFNLNRLLICDVGPNSENCGITVEKNLFTPRSGPRVSPDGGSRYSRWLLPQPAKQQPRPAADGACTVVPADDRHHGRSAEQRNGHRQPQRRIDQSGAGRPEQRCVGPAAWRRSQHLPGRVRSRQDLVLEPERPEGAGNENERDVCLRRESPERHDAESEFELRRARRRFGKPAVLPAGNHVGDERLLAGRQSEVRLAPAEYEPPPERRHAVHRRLHICQNHRLVAHGHPSA